MVNRQLLGSNARFLSAASGLTENRSDACQINADLGCDCLCCVHELDCSRWYSLRRGVCGSEVVGSLILTMLLCG